MNKRKQVKEAYPAVLKACNGNKAIKNMSDEINNQHEVLETLIAYLACELGYENARILINKLNTKGK